MVLTGPETGGPTCTRPCIPAPATINEPKPNPDTTTRQLNPFAACCPSPSGFVKQTHLSSARILGRDAYFTQASPADFQTRNFSPHSPRPKRECPPAQSLICNKSLTFPIKKRKVSNKRLGIEMTDLLDQIMHRYLLKVENM
jgi:hypothetical protein